MKLYHFTADWCQPCKRLTPIIEELLLENKDIDYIKIDVDDQGYIAQQDNVLSIPTLIIKNNGVEIKRHKGAASKEQIREFLNGL